MLYLEYNILNNFNYSIQQNTIPLDILAVQTYFYFVLVYTLVHKTISTYDIEESRHEKEVKQSLSFNYYTDTFESVDYDDYENKEYFEEQNDKELEHLSEEQSRYITILQDLIQLNSLNRQAILYYIQNLTMANKYQVTKEYFQVYEHYLEMLDFYGGKENFNLDMKIEPDIVLIIDTPTESLHIITSKAHLNFIAWVIDEGLYDYVILDKQFRYQILSRMCNDNLITSNQFIQFQLEDIPIVDNSIVEDNVFEDNEEYEENITESSEDNETESLFDIEKLNHSYVINQAKKQFIKIFNNFLSKI